MLLLVSGAVVGALLVGGMILIFTASWYFNHKTPIPEGCKSETKEVVKTIDMDKEVEEYLKENEEKK